MCFRNETSVSAACICRNNSARNEADRQHDTKEERKNLFEQLFSHHFSPFHFSPSRLQESISQIFLSAAAAHVHFLFFRARIRRFIGKPISVFRIAHHIVMVPFLLFRRKIRPPVAVLLRQVLVIPDRYADRQSLKYRPHAIAVLLPGRIVQLPLPIAMITKNITGFGRIPGDPLRIFTGNLRSSFGRTKEPVDQIQQLLTAGSVQAERRGQRMLIQTLEKLQPSARKPSVRITIQREHIYENAVVDRQMPCALLNIGRIGIPELAVDRRKSRIRAIIWTNRCSGRSAAACAQNIS